jgi:hypothetical protein
MHKPQSSFNRTTNNEVEDKLTNAIIGNNQSPFILDFNSTTRKPSTVILVFKIQRIEVVIDQQINLNTVIEAPKCTYKICSFHLLAASRFSRRTASTHFLELA